MVSLSDERVQPALHAMLTGDAGGLRAAIDADAELATGSWGENTLLEWATQPPHGVSPDVIAVLISQGSPLDRPLNLAGCWNLADMCQQLLDAGADPSVLASEGITPLESAAMHGATKSADVLAVRGLHRPSLWLAAAAGMISQVRAWVTVEGELQKPAGPYRANLADVGHPPGAAPTDDPAEILGEALVFAGANNRMAAVDYLLSCGVDINARPYLNTTALHLAILFRNPEAVAGLVERDARTDIDDDQHSSDCHGWAQACLGDDPASQRVAELLEASR